MKKVIRILSLFLVIISICGCNDKKDELKGKDEEGYTIGISNVEDSYKTQIKVLIDKINIREEADVNSNKIGVVQKDSVFDVIQYKADKKYIWFKIKTSNNITGYIASEIDNPYVKVNKDIDYFPPTLNIKKENISISLRTDADKARKDNIEYKDEKDPEPKMEYNIDYLNNKGNKKYLVSVTITDSSNNQISDTFVIEITGEKQMKDSSWLTYNEMVKKQNQARQLCYEYNMEPWDDAIGCKQYANDLNLLLANGSGTTRIGSNGEFCDYDISTLKTTGCQDRGGNIISYELISQSLKNLESTWLPKYEKYKQDVKITTGYDFLELIW